MNNITKIIKLIVGVWLLSASYLYGVNIEVDVLNENYTPVSILIVNFYTTDKTNQYFQKIKNIISQDLEESGAIEPRFTDSNIINNYTDFSENEDLKDLISEYSRYSSITLGKITYNESTQLYNITIVIFDSLGNINRKFGYKLSKRDLEDSYSNIAHDIANEIYHTTIDLPGYFLSSLVYAAGNKLMMADYNGKNPEVLVKTKERVMSPIISPDGNSILYVDFFKGESTIYIYDLYFKKSTQLATFQGLSLAPVFSANGQDILFSIANKGVTHIFRLNLDEKKLHKLTSGYSINLAGNESVDGRYLVYNSDKSGKPEIYLFNNKVKTSTLVSYGEGTYFTPSFSPMGNIILFTKIINRQFVIGLLNLGHQEKLVAKDQAVESPSWLPDGRHIIYQYAYKQQKGEAQYGFFIMDLMSGYKIQIQPTKDVRDPQISKEALYMKKINTKYSF